MPKEIRVEPKIWARSFVADEIVTDKHLLELHLKMLRDNIWNTIKKLTRKNIDDFPVEIKDWF